MTSNVLNKQRKVWMGITGEDKNALNSGKFRFAFTSRASIVGCESEHTSCERKEFLRHPKRNKDKLYNREGLSEQL